MIGLLTKYQKEVVEINQRPLFAVLGIYKFFSQLVGCKVATQFYAVVGVYSETHSPTTLAEAPFAKESKRYKVTDFNLSKKVVVLLSTTFFEFLGLITIILMVVPQVLLDCASQSKLQQRRKKIAS